MPDYIKYENQLKEFSHILSIFKNDMGSFQSKRIIDKEQKTNNENKQLELKI